MTATVGNCVIATAKQRDRNAKTRPAVALRKGCADGTLRCSDTAFAVFRKEKPMLRNRDEIRGDKCFDLLTDAILERDQPRTTDLFHRMVTRDGRSVGEAQRSNSATVSSASSRASASRLSAK